MRELVSNNSLFIGQLYEEKSLALRARDLIFFTTDLQTVNYCNGGKLEEAEEFECVFVVYCVLESLRARDLIFFTTDLQTVNYYSTIHCWS